MEAWGKVKSSAQYAGVSERTLRNWLNAGLRHVRLKTGTILIKHDWVDEYLESYEVVGNEVDKITEEICNEL